MAELQWKAVSLYDFNCNLKKIFNNTEHVKLTLNNNFHHYHVAYIIYREWKDGILPALLRKFCVATKRLALERKTCLQILQLDGEVGFF